MRRISLVLTSTAGALALLPTSAFGVAGDFFEPVTSPESAGNTGSGIVSADLDGDFDADLAIANSGGSKDLTILLGNGMGDFTPAVNSPEVGFGGNGLAVGDLDDDNDEDLAVATGSALKILLNDGMGNFSEAATSPETVTNQPIKVDIADMNGDMDLDIVVGQFYQPFVTVFINDGDEDGNFTALASVSAGGSGTNLTDIAAEPINNTAGIDVVVANEFTGDIRMFSNSDAAGTLVAQGTGFDAGGANNANVIAVGQFGSNSFNDVAVGNRGLNTINILLGVGDGNFTQAGTSPEAVPGGSAGNGPTTMVAADFNGDGFDDLAVGAGYNTTSTSRVVIMLGNGAGDFTPTPTSPEALAATIPNGITFDQFNGGNLDLAVANFFPLPNSAVNILLNDATAAPPGGGGGGTTTPTTTPPKKCKKGQKLVKGKCRKKKKKKKK